MAEDKLLAVIKERQRLENLKALSMQPQDKQYRNGLLGFVADPVSQREVASGLLGVLNRAAIGTVGAPVDMLTMGLRGLGYKVPNDKVVGSSEWIGSKLSNLGLLSRQRNPLAETLAGFVSPDPMDAVKLSSLMALPIVTKINPSTIMNKSTLEDIKKIIDDDDDFMDFGLRVIPSGYEVKKGDFLPPSKIWNDGIDTGELLPGTSAITVSSKEVEKAVKTLLNAGYPGSQIALVKGIRKGSGEDIGEVILSDAEVVKTW